MSMTSLERINQVFTKDKARIAYLTAGDCCMEHTLEAALALIAGGATILEIGVPFSDPIADGPVIQRAAQRALDSGTTLEKIIELIQKIRSQSTIPLILFSYFNPILTALKSNFLQKAKLAGVDGILIVDCPIEEMQIVHEPCVEQGMAPIYVISSTTPLDRVRKINEYGQGFLYYACQKGTTGIKNSLPVDFKEKMLAIKAISSLPVVVGFGISNREMAEEVLHHSDGVVVGSLFVKALENRMSFNELTKLAKSIYI